MFHIWWMWQHLVGNMETESTRRELPDAECEEKAHRVTHDPNFSVPRYSSCISC